MSDIAIKVENLSKLYQLGEVGTGTLNKDLNRWWAKLRGVEDPYAKVGQVNDRSKKAESDFVWAIKDINFEVKKGEVLGIIGKNGAGKSTLLKILSKITSPTTGKIYCKGRIASLLEVGTGFHPEMTGRENIFLNGAILGMRKWEIDKKFDEIVDFAGVEAYIDTPVKRYSSGMYVRLAFAVAAYLEPEILIVDEVLAVGDAEFQKKCLGRMKDVSVNDGRTVLFVSHNLSSMFSLCTKGIVLNNGKILYKGSIGQAIDIYLSKNSKIENNVAKFEKSKVENKNFELLEAEILNERNQPNTVFEIFDNIYFRLSIFCKEQIPNLYGYVSIKNYKDDLMIECDTFDILPNILDDISIGMNYYLLKINKNVLPIGEYIFNISFASNNSDDFLVDTPEDILSFSVVDNLTRRGIKRTSKTSYLIDWQRVQF